MTPSISSRIRRRSLFLAVASAGFLAPSFAFAGDFWWRGDLSNNWSANTTFLGGIVDTNFAAASDGIVEKFALPGPSDVVRFASSNAANLSTTLGGTVAINSLTTESSLTGNVAVSGGSLILVAGSIVANAPRTLTISSPVSVFTSSLQIDAANAGSSVALNSSFGGAVGLLKFGAGTLTLGSANTYTQPTVVNAGLLVTGTTNAIPTNSALTIGQNATPSTARVNTGGFSQTVSGLTLYARDFTSQTALDIGSGTFVLAGNLSLLDTVASQGNAYGATIASTAGGTLSLGNATRTFTLAGQNVGQAELIVNAIISNGGITLNANPSSTNSIAAGMLLNAPSANTYALGTTVNAGVLTVASTTTLGSGPLTFNTTGSVESRVVLNNASQSISSLSTGTLGTGPANLNLVGTALTINQSANTTFAGNISGGTGSITKTGTGILALSGTNTHAGGTTLSAGTLRINSATALPAGGNVTIVQGTLDLLANASVGNLVLGDTALTGARSVTGTGTLTVSGAISYLGASSLAGGPGVIQVPVALTAGQHAINNPNNLVSDSDYDVVFSSAISGAGGITTDGVNLYAALAAPNTYAGPTLVNGGRLFLAATNALPVSTALSVNGGIVILNPGATALGVVAGNYNQTIGSLAGTSAGSISLGTATLTINQSVDTSFAGSINGSGSITKTGSGILTLSGSNIYGGGTTLSAGTLRISSASALPAGGNVTVAQGTLDLLANATVGNLVFGDGLLTGARNLTGTGTLTVGGAISYIGVPSTSGQPGLIQVPVALTAGQHTINNPNNLISVSFYDLVFSSPISGAGGITKEGPGDFYIALTAPNTYAGPTIVNDGRLILGTTNALPVSTALTVNGGALFLNPGSPVSGVVIGNYNQSIGSLAGTSAGSISLGTATLTINQSVDTSFAGSISGSGSIIKTGSGTLTLSGSNNYTGLTTISGGILRISSTTSGGNVTVAQGALDLGTNVTVGNLVLGDAVLTGARSVTGTGTLTVGGAISFIGSDSAPGLIQVPVALTAGQHAINNPNNLISNSNYDLVFTSAISGTGGITTEGTDDFFIALAAPNTYAGPTIVNGGRLIAATTNALPVSTALTVNGGALSLIAGSTASGVVAGSYNQTIGSLAGTSAGSILLGNATLTVNQSVDTSYAGSITGSPGFLTKTGIGTLSLARIVGPGVTVSGGVLRLTDTAGGINGSGSASRLRSLSVAPSAATFDIRNNDVIVRNATASLATYQARVAQAYAGGLWNGTGITSSRAADDGLAVGIVSNEDLGLATFGGVNVASDDVLIKYTWFGDANLDGQVDGDDYLLWLAVFGSSGPGIGWAQGDYDYDTDVDGDDYLLWLQNFGNGVGSPLTSVPEPGLLGTAAVAGVAMLRRTRRRRSQA